MTTGESGPRSLIFYGWILVAAAYLLAVFYGLFLVYGVGVLLPPILDETGWGRGETSAVFGLATAQLGLMAPLYGMLIRRFATRIPVVAGSVLGGAGFLIVSYSGSLVSFYLGFWLAGFGLGIFYFGPLAAVANWFQRRRSLAIGIVVSGFALSALFVPVFQEVVTSLGWRETLRIVGLGAFVMCVPLSLMLRHSPEAYGLVVDGGPGQGPDEGKRDTGDGSDPSAVEGPGRSVSQVLRTPAFWVLSGLVTTTNFGLGAMLPHLLVFLRDVGIPESAGALAFSFYGIFSVLGRLAGGALGDVVDKRRVLAVCQGVLFVAMLGCAGITESWQLMLFFVGMIAPAFALTSPVIPALAADLFGRRDYALVFGLMLVPGTIVGIIGPGIAGWIADAAGSYAPAWLGFASFTLLGVPLSLMLPARLGGPSREDSR